MIWLGMLPAEGRSRAVGRMNNDLISRSALIEKIDSTNWYHISESGNLAEGANSKLHTPLFKADDIFAALENAPAVDAVEADAIEKLQAELEQVKRERDAAVGDMQQHFRNWWEKGERFLCHYCKHELPDGKCSWKMNHKTDCFGKAFEWRGVKEG